MIIKQVFNKGAEEECLEKFVDTVPDDPTMQEALRAVFDVVRNNVLYKKLFTIQVDTDAMTAEVVDVV